MYAKIASFILTLVLIAWQVFDLIQGRTGALTWTLLGGFTLMGTFELAGIIKSRHPAVTDGKDPAEHPAV